MSAEMTPKQFRRWRKQMGFSQKGAARALGLKARIVQYYEKGERDGKKVEVPRSVRLACWALTQGIGDFDGSSTVASAAAAADADAKGESSTEEPPAAGVKSSAV